MAIPLDTPVILPATDAVQYDTIWLSNLQIMASAQSCFLTAILRAAKATESGYDLGPVVGRVQVQNLFADITAEEQACMSQLVALLKLRAGI